MRRMFAIALSLFVLFAAPLFADDSKAMPDATLAGHKGATNAVAFSPDGKTLASVGDDSQLKLWDIAAKKEAFTVEGVTAERNPPKFTPDGSSIVLIGQDQKIAVIDVASGKLARSIPIADLPGGVTAIDLSPDGKQLVVAGNSNIRLLELASGNAMFSYEVHKLYSIPAVAFSPDGKTVATAATDKTSLILDPLTGAIPHTFELPLRGDQVLFSADGKQLFVYTSDDVLTAINVATSESQKLIDGKAHFRTMALSHDGKFIVLGGSGRAPALFSIAEGKMVELNIDSADFNYSAALSPDGQMVAGGANTGAIYLWTLKK